MAMLYYALAVTEVALLIVAMSGGIVVSALCGRQNEAFNGDCMLGANVIWVSERHFEVNPSGEMKCTFVVVMQALGAILAFLYGVYRIIVLCSGRFDFALQRAICVPLYSMMAFLTLSAAAVVSHGLNAFCDGFRSLQVVTANYDCELFQQVEWHIYDGSGFYEDFHKAEASGWVAFLAWVSLVAISVLHCLAERPDSGFPLPNNAK